jgi:hypothetical protein
LWLFAPEFLDVGLFAAGFFPAGLAAVLFFLAAVLWLELEPAGPAEPPEVCPATGDTTIRIERNAARLRAVKPEKEFGEVVALIPSLYSGWPPPCGL